MLFSKSYYFLCVYKFCLYVCMCTIYMLGTHGCQESLRFPVTEEKFNLVLR